MLTKDYYTKEYFSKQQKVGYMAAEVVRHLFQKHIRSEDKCIDFGCGGGFLLHKIQCADKIGVEINEVAIRSAEEKGLRIVQSLDEIEDQWADVVISNNALEHVLNPAEILATIFRKLKPGGKLILRVPHEAYAPYYPEDINKHLFSWTPMNIGNLTTTLGFKVLFAKETRVVFPPQYLLVYKIFGKKGFNAIAWLYSRLMHRWYIHLTWKYPMVIWNVLCVAQKPKE